MSSRNREGYLLEFHQARGAVKVSAIDPVTGVEVSIVGAPTATQAELSRLAVQKLEYRLRKERGDDKEKASHKGKGIII